MRKIIVYSVDEDTGEIIEPFFIARSLVEAATGAGLTTSTIYRHCQKNKNLPRRSRFDNRKLNRFPYCFRYLDTVPGKIS